VLNIGKTLQFIVNNRKKASNSNTDISFGTTRTYSVYPQTDKQNPNYTKNMKDQSQLHRKYKQRKNA